MRIFMVLLVIVFIFGISQVKNISNADEAECKNGYNIALWVKQDIKMKVDSEQEHPCGRTVVKCLKILPTNDPNLEPSYALEITPEGKVLNRWPVPVDSLIYAVSGPFLLIAAPNENYGGNYYESPTFYKVHYDGTIARTNEIKDQSIDSIECPKIDKPETGVGFCAKFKDQSTNDIRIIAFAIPCT